MRLPFTRLLRTTLLSPLAASILLLSSCTKKEQEQPAPISASAAATSVSADVLRQVFVSKQYDLIVNRKPDEGKASVRWEPQWEFLTWKRSADQVLYAFIPLEAYSISNAGQATPLLGVQKYLRFTQVDSKWDCALDTYLAKLPKGDLSKQVAVPSHLASFISFTGDEYVTQLASNEVTHYAYEGGVWKHSVASSKKQGDVATQTTPIPCKARYTCQWELYCSGINSDEGGGTSVPYTTNGDDCGEVPWGVTLGCGYETQYRLVNSFFTGYVCDGTTPPTPPTYPDPTAPGDPWIPTPERPFPDGVYVIKTYNWYTLNGSEPALAINGDSKQQGAYALQYNSSSYSNASVFWQLTFNSSDNTYTIQSVNSGLMLDVEWGATSAGTRIWQWPANGGDAQKWKFILIPGIANYSNRCMIQSVRSGLVLQQQNNDRLYQAYIEQGVPDSSPSASGSQQWFMNRMY